MARNIEDSVSSLTLETIRIGIGAGESLIVGMSRSLRNMKAYVDLSNGQVHSDRNFLIKKNMQKHKGADTTKISIDDQLNEVKYLKAACKNAGIDILINKRPDNMQEIYDKAINGGQLTKEELEYFNAFTIEDIEHPSHRVLLEKGFSIEFATADFDRMDKIVDQVIDKARGVAERSVKAREALDKLKETPDKIKEVIQELLKKAEKLERKDR